MYKQTLSGIKSPAIFIVFEIFIILFYTSCLAAVYQTRFGTIWSYLFFTFVFLTSSLYIFMATVMKYEYAILDDELIIRKFVRKKPVRIYSVKLVRSNCIYYNRNRKTFIPSIKNTHWMYIIGFDLFTKKCAIVFVDNAGVRHKLVFKPDKEVDEGIMRIKTAQWQAS